MKNADIVFKADGKARPIEPIFISADSTLQEAATLMRDRQCSVLRVGENGKTENIISAYDIIANAVAHNKTAAKTKVRDIMSASLPPRHSGRSASPPVKAARAETGHSRKSGKRRAAASRVKS